ncbi:MAG: FAD:protein FMN transferase [Myxococcales bacterium]|nr:FAD:protein FMN transferase [Myxococcales bacterium]
MTAILAVALAGCAHHPGPALMRASRPGAGTVVGITAPASTDPAAIDAAFAAIDAREARMSEWRTDSQTALLARGGPASFTAAERMLFTVAEEVRLATGGAFDLCWKGGSIAMEAGAITANDCPALDLGGLLKGWLADRAAAALLQNGVGNFVVDVGGDLVAHGDRGDGAPGWPVTAAVDGRTFPIRLLNAGLSTASAEQQPGHIADARSGRPAEALSGVFVVAPDGLRADAWDTGIFAFGNRVELPPGVCATLVTPEAADLGCR